MRERVPDWGKGLNKDLLPSELEPGFVSDCTNMRFRNGFAERMGGIATSAIYTTPTVDNYFLNLYQTTTARWLISAGLAKVYARNGNGTTAEITRYVAPVTVSSIVRVGTVATVTTATAHNLTTGDTVTFSGADLAPYNITATVTVTGATTFTYTVAGSPTTPAAGTIIYRVNVSANTADFTLADPTTQFWSGGSFNGVFILNSPADGLFWWAGDSTKKLCPFYMAPAPSTDLVKGDVARPFKNFIVVLAPTISGTKYPYRVMWSAAADPGAIPTTFIAASTNLAGDVEQAEKPGQLVDCLPYGNVNILYTQDARYEMAYIGGNDVFRFTRLPGSDGLLAVGAVADTPAGHVFVTKDLDVKVHQGGFAKSIAEGRVRSWLRTYVASGRVFLCTHQKKTEVWLYLSQDGATYPCALVWDWVSDTWGYRNLGATSNAITCACEGLQYGTSSADMVVASRTVRAFGLVESGTTDFGATTTHMLERVGLAFEDPETVKILSDSRWHIDGTAGATFSIYHGSSMTADGTVTYASPVTLTLGTTNWANAFANGGRYLALKLSTTATSSFALRSADVDFKPSGRF